MVNESSDAPLSAPPAASFPDSPLPPSAPPLACWKPGGVEEGSGICRGGFCFFVFFQIFFQNTYSDKNKTQQTPCKHGQTRKNNIRLSLSP